MSDKGIRAFCTNVTSAGCLALGLQGTVSGYDYAAKKIDFLGKIGFAKKIYEDVSIKADKKQELHSILRSIYESLGDLYSDQAKTKNTNEEKIDPLQKAADYYRLAILEIDFKSTGLPAQ